MRKFVTSGHRRYALALLVLGASLAVMGAQCQPTKPPAPPTGLSFSPTSHDFGNQGVNAGPTQSFSFTLTNHGPGTSEAFLPTVDHNNFNQFEGVNSNCPQTLDPGESCHVEVVFDPSIPGPLTSDLLAETNVGVDLAAATLTGTGVIV